MDRQLLEILVCPKCKGALAESDGGKNLICESCKVKFPVRDGIPFMTQDEIIDMRTGAHALSSNANSPRAHFKVVDGPDSNMTFQLERGTCRAMGRTTMDPNKTAVFNVDLALELDETTKRLVIQYISKQFRKAVGKESISKNKIGAFRRVSDIVFTDSTLSRLHAMIFYDEVGIGILDLVSKNGTYVNGKEIESKILKKGDVVELGETTLSFDG